MPKISYLLIEHPESFGSFGDFSAALIRLKELGYQGVEILMTEPLGFDVDALLRFVDSIELPVVSLLTGDNYSRDGLCLSSPDADVRRRAVERLQLCIETASRFEAIIVVGLMQGVLRDEPDPSIANTRIAECLKQVAAVAEKHGTTIVLEPVNHLQVGFNNTFSEVMAMIQRVGSAYFKPMLDSIHMNIEEVSVIEPIHAAGSDLRHFHLCESNGSFLGSGHLDIPGMFAALDEIRYSGFVSVKVYRHPWETAATRTMEHLSAFNLPTAIRRTTDPMRSGT